MIRKMILYAALTAMSQAAGVDPRQGSVAATARSKHYPENFEPRVFKGAGEGELKYGWLAPLHVTEGEKYPLLIAMHGSGPGEARACTILSRSPMREKYPVFVLAAEADRPLVWPTRHHSNGPDARIIRRRNFPFSSKQCRI
ncbi:MAG: hypothetical protein HZC28_14030 [Spirochaetes bacterium]|nr:hypothetical protein [Spirochaetota bacterium]